MSADSLHHTRTTRRRHAYATQAAAVAPAAAPAAIAPAEEDQPAARSTGGMGCTHSCGVSQAAAEAAAERRRRRGGASGRPAGGGFERRTWLAHYRHGVTVTS